MAEPPRPSSTGSATSNVSSGKAWKGGGRNSDHICVGEELRIGVDIALKKFRYCEEQKGEGEFFATP